MSFALAHKRRQIFTYTATLNQVTFGGLDDLSNTLDFPTGATHKVYHNDSYVDPNNYLILNNSVIFNTAPNIDNGTHTIKIIVQTLESSMNDYAFKIKTSADDTEAYLVQNDPNYNPTDPNTYYSKIRIEDDYLIAKDYAHQNYAIGAAMDAISDSKSFAQAEVLQEISRATEAESDLDTRLAILEAAANQGYELNTFTATQGQTTFTLNYDVGMIAVFINGILLDESDYTATSGTDVVLIEAADAGDIVSIPEYSTSGAVQQANQVTTYSGANALPSSNNTVGDFAFTTDTKSLYIWNGSAWDRVYNGPNQTVSWTTQALASYTLATDGSDTTVTTLASDPEGFDITYGYVTSPSTQAQATIVNNNDGTFTLTPSTDSADNGTFTFRATATDGVHIISSDSTVELALETVVNWTVNISNLSYDNVSLSTQTVDTGPMDITFNNDGTKMYLCGGSADAIYQYSLTTGYDITTATYDSISFSVTNENLLLPNSVIFNSDGTKMFVGGSYADALFQYSLSNPYDLSTAIYDNINFSVLSENTSPASFRFANDGNKLFVLGASATDAVYSYSLSSAFDITSASYDNVSFNIAAQGNSPSGMFLNPEGTKIYITEGSTDSVYQYSMSTAFDLSTASYDNISFSLATQDTTPQGIVFIPDGTKMLLCGNGNNAIYQYSTGL